MTQLQINQMYFKSKKLWDRGDMNGCQSDDSTQRKKKTFHKTQDLRSICYTCKYFLII